MTEQQAPSNPSNDVMKYHRLKGKLSELLKQDKVESACIEENAIIVGTFRGFVHVISFAGHGIRSFASHKQPVRGVSADNVGLNIASCSADGNVVLYGLGEVEVNQIVVSIKQPLSAICVDKISLSKKDKSFIVGCKSGELILHKQAWFSQKKVQLFPGAQSPVTSIAWRGNIVAWADATCVRLMDVSTQTGLCYLPSPAGVTLNNPYPCNLYWETDNDLLVGWADNFRHVVLTRDGESRGSKAGGGGSNQPYSSLPRIVARNAAEWEVDCIICGLCSFDADHVTVLGYFPEDDSPSAPAGTPPPPAASSEGAGSNQVGNSSNFPEIQILKRSSGELVCSDTIEMNNLNCDNISPYDFHLLTNYLNLSRSQDFYKWSLKKSVSSRGGSKGLSPTLFILSGADIVVGRVRDTIDRIEAALEAKNIPLAVDIALSDRNSLRLNQLDELVSLHLDVLFQQDKADVAAVECRRIFDKDRGLWEKWISVFAKRNCLSVVVPYIPTGAPRLSPAVYDMVLDSLLMSNTKAFYDAISRWSHIFPSVFDVEAILSRLQKKMKEMIAGRGGEQAGVTTAFDTKGAKKVDVWLQESEGHMLIMLRQYSKALNSYLSLASFLRRTQHQRMMYVLTAESPAAALGSVSSSLYDSSSSMGPINNFFDSALQSYSFGSSDVLEVDDDNGSTGLQEYLESIFEIEDEGLVGVYESRVKQLSSLLVAPSASVAAPTGGLGFASGYESTIFGYSAAAEILNVDGESVESAHSYMRPLIRNPAGVFDLIEKQNLYDHVKNRVQLLLAISRPLAMQFLLKHVDKLPIIHVARQLRTCRRVLKAYLHGLFQTMPEVYNSAEYAEFHAMQVSLYAQFAPRRHLSAAALGHSGSTKDISDGDVISVPVHHNESDFMIFLKGCAFISLEQALRECENPSHPISYLPQSFYSTYLSPLGAAPSEVGIGGGRLQDVQHSMLYDEIIYIYTRLGRIPEAMTLLLKEKGDAYEALRFIEEYGSTSSSTQGANNLSTSVESSNSLVNQVVKFALVHPYFLLQLLDAVGTSTAMDPLQLISKIPPKMELPGLKSHIATILKQYDFQVSMKDLCRNFTQDDTIGQLTKLNQSKRRGIKVSPASTRCPICGRPIIKPPTIVSHNTGGVASAELTSSTATSDTIAANASVPLTTRGAIHRHITPESRVLGTPCVGGIGIVVFSGRTVYHRQCFDRELAIALQTEGM